jgi:hypothetical protein
MIEIIGFLPEIIGSCCRFLSLRRIHGPGESIEAGSAKGQESSIQAVLERFANACMGKWRDLRYGAWSVGDPSLDQHAY